MKDILKQNVESRGTFSVRKPRISSWVSPRVSSYEQITVLLTGLQMRGVTVDELLGFRDGILATGVPAILDCDRYIDGLAGGDRKNTQYFYYRLLRHCWCWL